MDISNIPRYNMNLVLRETGLKADTLRAWERRYQLPQPERTQGGHRLFSDYDIAIIKWLQGRLAEGMRISQAVDLWRETESLGINPLENKNTLIDKKDVASSSAGEKHTLADLQQEWIEACMRYDEGSADQVLIRAFAQFPLEIVCYDLIYPALNQIGEMWYQGNASVHQEHFTSELASRKLQTLISSAPKPIHTERILLGCPEGETHTISALMLTLLLKFQGFDVIYLGGNVPIARFIETIEDTAPRLVIMIASRLTSAATLLDSVKILNDYQVPVAFGGWIFTQINSLSDMIPAYYLGKTLDNVIPKVNDLIFNSEIEQLIPTAPNSLENIKRVFESNKNSLDLQMVNTLKDSHGKTLLPSQSHEINNFFIEGIIAALSFGDLNLLRFDLDWISGLLKSRYDVDNLGQYLQAFRQAINENLGLDCQPIADWLTNIINHQESKGY